MASTTVPDPMSASPTVHSRSWHGRADAASPISRSMASLPTGLWCAKGGAGFARRPLASHRRSGRPPLPSLTSGVPGQPGTEGGIYPVAERHDDEVDVVRLATATPGLRALAGPALPGAGQHRATHPAACPLQAGQGAQEPYLHTFLPCVVKLIRPRGCEAFVATGEAHRPQPEPPSCTGHVHRRVSPAEHKNPRWDGLVAARCGRQATGLAEAGDVTALKRGLGCLEERRRIDDPAEISPRYRQPHLQRCPIGKDHRIVLVSEAVDVYGAYVHAAAQVDAGGGELFPRARGHSRGEKEIGDAPAEQASGLMLLLVDRDGRAGFDEFPRGADPGGSGADHRDGGPGATCRVLGRRRDGGLVGDETLELADRDGRATGERPGAGALALDRLIAHAAAHIRQHRGAAKYCVGRG